MYGICTSRPCEIIHTITQMYDNKLDVKMVCHKNSPKFLKGIIHPFSWSCGIQKHFLDLLALEILEPGDPGVIRSRIDPQKDDFTIDQKGV